MNGYPQLNIDHGRISLEAETVTAPEAGFEVAALGHTGVQADLSVFFAHCRLVHELETLGYTEILADLRAEFEAGIESADLFNIPIPVRSLDEYNQLFSGPEVVELTPYASAIAGSDKWLPKAVHDFFLESQNVQKKLWVIPVDPDAHQSVFYPTGTAHDLSIATADAFTRALALPQLAMIILPDFERLQIPANLPRKRWLRLANPEPSFLPCSTNLDDGIRERAPKNQTPKLTKPDAFMEGVKRMLQAIKHLRSDVRLLLSLPFDSKAAGEQAQLSKSALADIKELKTSSLHDSLHRIQMVYPYLMDEAEAVSTSCGLLAGQMATRTAQAGAWRSIAGRNLPGDFEAWPKLSQRTVANLREEIGIGVLRNKAHAIQLDDERLCAGVFTRDNMPDGLDASGEISRFMGWLHRSLEILGLRLVFDTQVRSRQALIHLEDFFTRLYHLGALRGASAEQSYTIEQTFDRDNGVVMFSIAISPAFPIEHIRIHVKNDRVEFAHG